MAAKYPVLPPEKVIAALRDLGFEYKSTRGSHVKYVKANHIVIIPLHHEVAKGTLRSILEQAGLSLEDFLKHI